MKKILLFLIAISFINATFAEEISPLAERHSAKGITCIQCHLVEKPEPYAEVDEQTCFSCHPQEAIINKFSAMGDRNPHKNHLGEVPCNICHRGHQPPVSYCANCHRNFSHKLK